MFSKSLFYLSALLSTVSIKTVSADECPNTQSMYCYSDTSAAADVDPVTDWNITLDDELRIDHYLTENGYYPDGLFVMSTNYTMHDHHYDVQLFESDCLTAPTGDYGNFPLIFILADNDPTAGLELDVELFFLYNQTMIETSSLWTANKTGGYSEFCIRVSNYLAEEEDAFSSGPAAAGGEYETEINFLEVIYRIEVDSITEFDTSVNIERISATDGGVDFIDYEETIDVYQCDDSFTEITSPPELTQGDYLQVCVSTAAGSNFGVHSIKELDVSQDSANVYPYVDAYLDSPLTFTDCTASNQTDAICKAKMQLLAIYFEDEDPSNLDVEGTVKLDYVGRRLSVDVPVSVSLKSSGARSAAVAAAEGGRKLEESGSSFAMEVKITSAEDESGSSALSVASMMSTAVAFLAGMLFL